MIHLVVFLILGRGYLTIFTGTQHTTERVEEKNKQTNKHGLGSAPSARKGEVYDTFCAFCELTRACTQVKTLTKPLAMLTSSHVGQSGLCRSTGLSSCLSDFCSSLFSALLSSPDCLLLPTGLCCSLLLTAFSWDLPSLIYFWSQGRSWVQALWQNRQRDSLTGTHTHRNGCRP